MGGDYVYGRNAGAVYAGCWVGLRTGTLGIFALSLLGSVMVGWVAGSGFGVICFGLRIPRVVGNFAACRSTHLGFGFVLDSPRGDATIKVCQAGYEALIGTKVFL